MRRSILPFALLLALSSPAFAAPSRAFVTDAIKGDNSEIMLGKMAQDQGASEGVKQFGATLVTDHTEAKQQMAGVANQLGVPVPDGPTDKAQQEQQKLSNLHGAAFDHEFVSYMVKDHKQDIAKFRREARAHDPAGLMAAQQLPVLEKHLQIAESLEKSGQ